LFVNLEKKKTNFVAKDKDSTTIKAFSENLLIRQGNTNNLSDVA
jgi:hypothetical protein